MKNFLLPVMAGLLAFPATGAPLPATTDSLGNRIYNLNAVTVISNPKWESKLFEFPGSISYLDTENIDEMNIHSVKDISTIVPNLFIPNYGSKLISSAYIRGIGSRINSPAVGLYVDNIPYLDKSAFDFDFIDIASIEVLKGPQGTLYGRNTMAGLVNIKTFSPLERQGSKVKLSFGNYNLWGVAASTSQKIADGLAFSVNARYRQDDGYFKNQYTRQNSGSTRSGGGRMQIDWRVNRQWKLSLSGDYESSDQQGYPYAYYDKASQTSGDISYNDEASYRRDIFTSGLSAQYLDERFIFTSTTGYQYLDDDMRLDQDFTPLSVFTLQQKQKMHAVSQEFAVKSHKGGRWDWVGGLFGFYQDTHTKGPVDFRQDGIELLITQQTNNQLAALKQNPNLAGMPDITVAIDNENLYIDGTYKTPTYGAAAFGQASLNHIFIDGLSATAGLRIDYERTQIYHHTHAADALSGQAHVTVNAGGRPIVIQQPFALPLGIDGKESMETIELSPKFELKYTIDSDNFVYASASRGYRSGGYNFQMFSNLIQSQIRTGMMSELMKNMGGGMGGNSHAGAQVAAGSRASGMPVSNTSTDVSQAISYKPEHSWNYEIGGRSQLIDHRLFADLTLFYIDCHDQQIALVSGYGRYTKNSGRTASYGLEASLKVIPTQRLLLSASYGYTHATFKNYNDGENDYKGNFVPFAPAHTLALSGAYTLPIDQETDVTFDLQYMGQGKIYWTEANDVAQNFYGLVNASIILSGKYADLKLWGKNLLNRRYQAFYFETMNAENLSTPNSFVQHGRPITFGADITIKF